MRYRLLPLPTTILLFLVTLSASRSWGEEGSSPGPAQPPEAIEEADPGNIDKLLSMAEKDVGQLTKVDVGHTGSPSLDMTISTVDRRESTIGRTPAAVYVVTNEMIRRCGGRNIPEVLRTVPGVDVARVNASTWAISIRGFSRRFSNKLLVQIDGVPILTPMNNGVYWEREPVMLEDVERIEIVRGPGGSLWGNNAVNGIINIVTKSSKDTKGVYADVGGGTEHRQFSNVRAGGQSGNLSYRVWGTNMDDSPGYLPPPQTPFDHAMYGQGGFRTDWAFTKDDTLTFEGDLANGESLQMPHWEPTKFQKTMFMTRWAHRIDEDTDWQYQCDYYNAHGAGNVVAVETSANFDLDFQFHLNRDRHDIVWGCGYKNVNESLTVNSSPFPFYDTVQVPSYFVQDTITLVEDRLFATFGSKFDHNSVTNFEYQPTAKLTWTPDDKTSIWGAISRAVREPCVMETEMITSLRSEDMLSYEVGYRRQSTEKYFWETAVFFSRYGNIMGGINPPMSLYDNVGNADTYGIEYNAIYEATSRWRLTGSYAFFMEYFEFVPGYRVGSPIGTTPRNKFYLQSGWDLGHDVTFDLMLRYVDSLAAGVENYFVGDMRIAWSPRRNIEFSVVGQNLFDDRHYEFPATMGSQPTQVEQAVYGMVSWRY